LLDRTHEDLAVANLAGAGGLDDRFHGTVDNTIIHHRFDLDLGQEVDDILRAPVQLGMALLAAESFYFRHCQARNADIGQRFTDFVKLERFDDCSDLFQEMLLRFELLCPAPVYRQ
jgi:hypothetical protein